MSALEAQFGLLVAEADRLRRRVTMEIAPGVFVAATPEMASLPIPRVIGALHVATLNAAAQAATNSMPVHAPAPAGKPVAAPGGDARPCSLPVPKPGRERAPAGAPSATWPPAGAIVLPFPVR